MRNDIPPEVLGRARDLAKSPEAVLSFLREEGVGKGPSIRAFAEIYRIALDEAKGRVHLSAAWADARNDDEALHERIFNALRESPRPVKRFRPKQ